MCTTITKEAKSHCAAVIPQIRAVQSLSGWQIYVYIHTSIALIKQKIIFEEILTIYISGV